MTALPQERPRAPAVARSRYLAFTAVIVSLGLALLAFADHRARSGLSLSEPFYWAGLVVVFGTPALRLVASRSATGSERWMLVLLAASALYLLKVMHSPIGFTFTDELQQLRSVLDVDRTGHLYTPNPLVSAYPYFPGLGIALDAFTRLTGAANFVAGLMLLAASRLLFVSALFLLLLRLTKSSKLAALACFVYMTNPNFVYFSAQVAYESFTLPLACLALVAVHQLTSAVGKARLRWWAACLVLFGAVAVSHHITSIWLVGMLILWTASGRLVRPQQPMRAVGLPAVAAAGIVGMWFSFVAAEPTFHELGPVVTGAWSAVYAFLQGRGTDGKVPFEGAQGPAQPFLEQLFGFGAVVILLAALPLGLVQSWRHRRSLVLALVVLAVLYPVTLALRLFQAGTEISSRASEFVFFGVSLMAAITLLRLATRGQASQRNVRKRRRRPPQRRVVGLPLLLNAVVLVCLLVGGIIVGWAPYARLPGPFLVEASSRSIKPEGLAAARWAGSALPRRGRVVTNGTNRVLFGSLGGLDPQSGVISGLAVPDLFFAQSFDPTPRAIVLANKIRYIIADVRLTRSPSRTGTYFFRDEPRAYQRSGPLPPETMAKFDFVRRVDRIYDSGNIKIYDTGGLLFPNTGINP